MSPEAMQRMKDMLTELNDLLAMKEAGQDTQPAFEEFMERYGDFFPENPQTLDELLELMAQRMAAMQAMLNSMTPEQRAQLQGLSEQLLEDMDLRWQMDQLGGHLQQLFPQMGWDRRYDFSRPGPARLRRGRPDAQRARRPRPARADAARRVEPRARWPRSTSTGPASCSATTPPAASSSSPKLAQQLEDAGLINNKEGRLELTPKGLRKIGRNALSDLFSKLARDKLGRHEIERTGHRPRAHLRHQALRVRRPVQPPHRAHGPQRRPPHGRRHAGAAHAGRLRGRADRADRARRPRC